MSWNFKDVNLQSKILREACILKQACELFVFATYSFKKGTLAILLDSEIFSNILGKTTISDGSIS